MNNTEFRKLLSYCSEIAEGFPDGVVFIGGIAVYLHAINSKEAARFAETTHDADFYISMADMSDLRDLEEVTPNRRLSKHQLIKGGFEFDIYTERYSALIIPYDQVIAGAEVYEHIRVANLAHLFMLKLDAFRDRRQSAKGDKDARDLLRIAMVASAGARRMEASQAAPYLRDDHLSLLEQVERGAYALSLAQGNAQEAKKIRQAFASVTNSIRQA